MAGSIPQADRSQPIRALVVDDSLFFRTRITRILNADPELQVVGHAADGREAVSQVRALNPDIVTMDVEMPVMDGISAVREIMRLRPTRIIMLSAHTRAGAEATLNALDAGAADFVTKTVFSTDGGMHLVARIKELVGRAPRRATPVAPPAAPAKAPAPSTPVAAAANPIPQRFLAGRQVLAIGASTGGPALIANLLAAVPADFPCPILIAQHMPGTFTECFAARLDRACALSVQEAKPGDVLAPGKVFIAPGGRQTTVGGDAMRAVLTVSDAGDYLYKPSVDVMFTSVAAVFGGSVLALILTGMGSDGVEGGRLLKARGAEIWAQDEASSVVFGMPMVAIKAGIVDRVLSAEELRARLASAG
ncbi:MAG: chemotaxis response regulator protein-glutamate methylesterase [Gammaproteobacteria bacterium]|nr:chemotaxis response regulator protein-glutamate methylesterase [Gammaproteobacteria bacterium]MBI5615855.1 chemotaxis response regulator protein-glutamate methylesterase [Gammaproteobacteria bacterium]